MITASQQIDRVANSLTDLARSRAMPAREVKPLVLRLDRIANTLDQEGTIGNGVGSATKSNGQVVWAKLKKAKAVPEENAFTGYEAVQRYGVTPEEWSGAKREGVVTQNQEGLWEVSSPTGQAHASKKKFTHR